MKARFPTPIMASLRIAGNTHMVAVSLGAVLGGVRTLARGRSGATAGASGTSAGMCSFGLTRSMSIIACMKQVRVHHPRPIIAAVAGSNRGIFHAQGSDAKSADASTCETPSTIQLRRLFLQAAVPMIGFGFMDNVVMITMGDIIDNSLGVTFGLSTLTAAGIGQIFSDVSGVCFGGTVEALVSRMGLPTANLSTEQAHMRVSKLYATMGAACGVILGCLLGMTTLLFRDAEGTEERKHEAVFNKMIESESEAEISAYVAKLKHELKKAENALKHSERALIHLTPLVETEEHAIAASKALTKIQSFNSEMDKQKPQKGAEDALKELKKRVSTVLPPHVLAAMEEAGKLKAEMRAKKGG